MIALIPVVFIVFPEQENKLPDARTTTPLLLDTKRFQVYEYCISVHQVDQQGVKYKCETKNYLKLLYSFRRVHMFA